VTREEVVFNLPRAVEAPPVKLDLSARSFVR
jgi:hypothetical protein